MNSEGEGRVRFNWHSVHSESLGNEGGTGTSGGLSVQGSCGLSDPVVIFSDPDVGQASDTCDVMVEDVSHSGDIIDVVLSTLDRSQILSDTIDAMASGDGLIFGDSSNLLVVAESFTISSTNLLSTIFARTYKIRRTQLDIISSAILLLLSSIIMHWTLSIDCIPFP